jgi:uncharacterized protein
MDSIAPDLTKPLRIARKGWFLGRLAEGVSQPPWSWRMAGGAVLVSFAGFLGLPQVTDLAVHYGLPDVRRFWPILLWAIPMLCALAYLTRQAGTTLGQVFGLRGARVGPVLASGLLLFILQTLLMVGIVILLTWIGLEKGPGAEAEAKAYASSFFSVTHVTVWVPLCEELWFRALLYTSLRTRFGVAASAVVTAALFAAVHSPETPVEAAGHFFQAVLFSFWYERTRSLWPNVIGHSLHNALPCAVLFLQHAHG